MTVTANEVLVRRAIEAIWNRGDLDVADDLFTLDYVNHEGLISDLVLGPEAMKISAAFYRLAFPDLCVTVDELSTNDDTVVFRWTARRTSTDDSESGGITTDQKLLTGITRSRLAGGKITETWTEWDRTRVLHDLRLEAIG